MDIRVGPVQWESLAGSGKIHWHTDASRRTSDTTLRRSCQLLYEVVRQGLFCHIPSQYQGISANA